MASRFPNELYESIISNFSPPTTLSTASCRSTIPTLKSLSLVSQAFRSFAQSHLFSTFHLDCEVKGLKGKCKLLALDEYRLARYVRILRINLYVIHQAGVDEIVESVVPHFTRIVEVEISGAGAFVGSARCERWASCRDSHSSLRYVFAREVFPRVRRLMMECFLDLPMGHALMTCGKLKHLSLRQIGGGVCSCGDEDENVPKANEGCPPHPLESLMIGTYCAEDFEIGGPLMNFLDQSRCSIRKIQLGSHVNTLFHSLSSLSSVENMFSRCASTLTHLHLGAELYRKLVRLQTSDIERINLARFTALEVLQAELVLYGADERFHGARVYPGDGLWWRDIPFKV
ncbi:hypothetical protein DL96DRAFT_775519 [Flagelloscypha sp. PMI_526]|nr:hypothetical protein DL96DRAFT_775519 [Flagelloscypha sp. PMI_526]